MSGNNVIVHLTNIQYTSILCFQLFIFSNLTTSTPGIRHIFEMGEAVYP